MRSADLSGVGAERFSVGKGATGKGRTGETGPSGPLQALQLKLSPITTAVTLVALISATVFVIFDTVRTLDDARTDLAVIGRTLAEDIAEMAPGAALAMLQSALDRYEVSATATLEPAGTSTAPTLLSVAVPAGQHGVLSLRLNDGDALGGITQRGVGAFALAFLLIGLNWRQRQASEMPDAWQRRNYQTLAAAIPMGIACWTQSGRLIVCNQQYRDRLKLSSKSMTYHEAVKQLILGGYMKLINEDDSNRLLEVHREDGSCLLIDERPLADGGFMTLVSDVTEAKRTDTLLSAIREEQRLLARRYHEEKLRAEAASRSKTNFLAHLSHDIRTPLNHIIGFAELMRHQTYGPLGDARYGEYVQSIKASGEHLLASFATILDLAELESGQKILRADPVPVDQLLAKSAERFCPQAKRAGVAIVLGDPCGAVLIADGLGMQRMVGNLLDNAIRFTPAGGRIALAAFAAEDGVVIEVSDTGTGMSEERLQSLSHPFALGDATFTREGVGPGLGISISRAIAELSGGRLAIDSSPSLGTTVAISLPLPEAAAVRHAAE